ncbi:bile salt-activated lipase-like [Mytilus californianus]|uniref:bile salt-activated lipase-like n=1 Tax=Mytilus californianus TaxID=6549 RepID=UPI002245C3BE|nr:bile salt-activated lipase-like [Mytilus californianus]
MFSRVVFLVVLYPMLSKSQQNTNTVVVTTTTGSIKGVSTSFNDMFLQSFYGIPYAEPPERFKKPTPVKSWEGTKDCTQQGGKICSQPIIQELAGFLPSTDVSEDCLLLDIFVPVSNTKVLKKKAVVIWFAGDNFEFGQRGLLPTSDLVMYGDVINVVVAYRLGVFGFLSTGDSVIPGNFGLWDQKMAIEWIKANIDAFGGDSYRITLAGFGAGAISATLQAHHQSNDGNFQRLLIYSDVSHLNGNVVGENFYFIMQIARTLTSGLCPSNSKLMLQSQEIYDCLISKTETELISETKRAVASANEFSKLKLEFDFRPVFDNDFIKDLYFTELIPVDLLATVSENEHALNVYEQLIPYQTNHNFDINKNIPRSVLCDLVVPTIADSYLPAEKKKEMINNICNRYTSSDETEQSRNVLRLIGDFYNYVPVSDLIFDHADYHLDRNNYLCLWSQRSPLDDILRSLTWMNGTVQNDALIYLLGIKSYQMIDPNAISEDLIAFAESTIQFYSNFIKTGNPNSNAQLWPLYTADDEEYIQMKLQPITGSRLFEDRVFYWLDEEYRNVSPLPTDSVVQTEKTTAQSLKATRTRTTTKRPPKTTKQPLVLPKLDTTTTIAPVNSSVMIRFSLIQGIMLIIQIVLLYKS